MTTTDHPTRPALTQRRRAALGRTLRHLLLAAAASLAGSATLAQVGYTQLQAGDLPVTLVYPSAQAVQPRVFGPITLQVAMDAAPRPGRYPLVVMSHGTGGSPLADHDLAATLVRAGFVVAQPLHAGDNHRDARAAGPAAWQTRPAEVSRTLDMLAAHPDWQARLRLDQVGVHGMSAGGVTALALAGAQWRLLDLVKHCQDHAQDDLGFCFNGLASEAARAERQAQYNAARGVPEAYLPAALKVVHGGTAPAAAGSEVRPDVRVASVTLSVPVAAIFSADSLARVRIPVGVVSAGRDSMLLPAYHSGHVLRHCKACQPLADLAGAGHLDLLSPWPEALASGEAARQARGGSPEPGFDPREREAAFQAIAAFHQRQLGR